MRSRGVLVLLCGAALGCGGSDSPVAPITISRFALISSDGQVPPFRQFITEVTADNGSRITCDNDLTGVTVDIESSSRYLIAYNYLQACNNGRPDVTSVKLENGSYAIRGDSIQLTSDPNSTGTRILTGRINEWFLTINRAEARVPGAAAAIRTNVLLFGKIF